MSYDNLVLRMVYRYTYIYNLTVPNFVDYCIAVFRGTDGHDSIDSALHSDQEYLVYILLFLTDIFPK